MRPALALALLLALASCRATPIAPGGNPEEGGAPPTGQAPWLAPPGPGWTMVVREEGNSVVMVEDASVSAAGDRRRARLLINYVRPMQAIAGRPIRSELAELELDCPGLTYRLPQRRLFDAHGATGASLPATVENAEVPMRPVIAGSIAEALHAALCAPPPAPR